MRLPLILTILLFAVCAAESQALTCAELCNQARQTIRANKSEVAALAMQEIGIRYGVSSPYETVRYTAQGGYYLASAISGEQYGPMKLSEVCPSLNLGALSDTPFRIAALAYATKRLTDKQAPWTCR